MHNLVILSIGWHRYWLWPASKIERDPST